MRTRWNFNILSLFECPRRTLPFSYLMQSSYGGHTECPGLQGRVLRLAENPEFVRMGGGPSLPADLRSKISMRDLLNIDIFGSRQSPK